jgi:hypothetical protein
MSFTSQYSITMKNARKQLGEIAAIDATQINPGPIVCDNTECLPIFENAVFHEKPRPRLPESQEEENFRSLLKTSLDRHRAPASLIERIRNIVDDNKL